MKKNSSKTTDVDLQLLTNPIFNSSLSEKNNKEKQNHSKNSSNIKLYKKKIFLLTKDFLNNKKAMTQHLIIFSQTMLNLALII